MARTDVAINSVTLNDGAALTETATSAGMTGANGYSLTGAKSDSKIRIVLKNTGSATGSCFVQEGGYINGVAANEIQVVVGGDVTKVIAVDGSRSRQTDATIDVDVGFTGLLYAFQG
jgi:hypothetical protein